MTARKPLLIGTALGLGALLALLALPAGVSFARRSARPSADVTRAPLVVVPPAPPAPVEAPAPRRAAARPSPAATRPFGRVPGAPPSVKRPDGHVEGAILGADGAPFRGGIAAVPVGGGDAVYTDADADGRFSLRLPPGTYTFSVYSNGDVAPEVIESLPVDAGEQLHGVVVQLPADAFAHDPDESDGCEFDPDRHFDDNPDLDGSAAELDG